MSEFYTVSEVAKMLRVKKAYVYELIYTGRLKAVKLSERRIRVTQIAINNFIENTEKESARVVAK